MYQKVYSKNFIIKNSFQNAFMLSLACVCWA